MTVHKTWVVIYSSDPLANHDLAKRLEGLEWWITDRHNAEESKTATRMIDLTKLKDQQPIGQGESLPASSGIRLGYQQPTERKRNANKKQRHKGYRG